MIKASLVIPTYKHLEDFLKPCCESIIKYTDLDNIEIVIVANGCGEDGTREYIESLPEQFKLVWVDEGMGYTKATNLGVERSCGDIIILMNNDVVLLDQPKNQWLDFLCDSLKNKIGVTCNLKLFDQHSEHWFAVGFLLAIKRVMWDKVGGLDPAWSPGGGEDVELCIKVEQLGYKVLQVPDEINIIDYVNGLNVNHFMSYHKGEGTMLDAEHQESWNIHIKKCSQKLESKFKLPWGCFSNADIEEYRRLVEDLPDGGTMVEIGVYKGRSLCSVADIIKRKNIKVWAVDCFTGTKAEGQNESNFKEEFLNNCRRFGIEPIAIENDSIIAASLFEDGFFDLIFIDADHRYECIKKDVEACLPKLKEHGTISGHDYGGSWEGISRFINEKWDHVRVSGEVWSKRV